MKKRLIILSSAALCMFVLFSAFTALPRIWLGEDQGEITFGAAVSDGGTLTLYADYDLYGRDFEIARDIALSPDEGFSSTFRLISCLPQEDGTYKYTFETGGPVDRVFVAPPILYIPRDIPEVTAGLAGDEVPVTVGSETWFTVTSVEIGQPEDGRQTVRLLIEGTDSSLIPRLPRLSYNGEAFDGTSSLSFDKDMGFTGGEFVFQLPAPDGGAMTAEGMTLTVGSALERVEASSAAFEGQAVVFPT